MKKQLLLGTALLAAIGAFSQQSRNHLNSSPEAYKIGTIADKYAIIDEGTVKTSSLTTAGPAVPVQQSSAKKGAALGVWNAFSSSENAFGVLVSASKPLQYNEDLDVVSFIQRRSSYYVANPTPDPLAASGVMVAMITSDWGNNWDSTCIWNRDSYWARYPQGGIYNTPGNTNLNNAYAVAMGPGTTPAPQLWVGNFFASKKLDTFSNSPDTDPMSQQFILSSPADSVVGKVDFARNDFTIPDDGIVRGLGGIYNDINSSTDAGFQGIRMVKGAFNPSGYFTWTSDSLFVKDAGILLNSVSGRYYVYNFDFNMAWSESGQVGYRWFYGVAENATGRNMGYQPVVQKTTDYGVNWVPIGGINFNDTAKFKVVLDRMIGTNTDSTMKIPMFNRGEDISGVVDKNDNLHIVATVWDSYSSHPDSIGYRYIFNHTDGEKYTYAHRDFTDGFSSRPYIYDFFTTGNSWDVVLVDVMGTESPGVSANSPNGYNHNPWKANGTPPSKLSSDARIQTSRTPDGEYIVYTWAESDTLTTASGFKWNLTPDIHVRVRHVDSTRVHETEYNITNDPMNPDLNVAGRAWLHNVSPKCALTATAANGFTITLPVKVTNSTPLDGNSSNTHYFSAAVMSFTLVDITGIAENNMKSVKGSMLYPNPASGNANLLINLNETPDVDITIMNTMGQIIRKTSMKGTYGQNNMNVNIEGLSSGIYLVKVSTGGASSTKKLMVE